MCVCAWAAHICLPVVVGGDGHLDDDELKKKKLLDVFGLNHLAHNWMDGFLDQISSVFFLLLTLPVLPSFD